MLKLRRQIDRAAKPIQAVDNDIYNDSRGIENNIFTPLSDKIEQTNLDLHDIKSYYLE